MTQRFKDKVVLISGAGQGIGLATAKRMSSEGAIIIAGILDDSQAEAVKDYDSVRLNVRHEESWDAAIDSLMKSHGGLDVLINNAGISPQATAEETTREFWDEVMEINLRGSFLGCQKAIPIMRNRGGGAIVNLASINGIRGNRRLVAYAATMSPQCHQNNRKLHWSFQCLHWHPAYQIHGDLSPIRILSKHL